MRFTDSKKRYPWFLFIIVAVFLAVFLMLGLCDFQPKIKTIHKTIVFEAD